MRMINNRTKLWSILTCIGVVVAIIGSIFTIDDRYAKGQDLKILEQKSAQSLDEFNKNQTLQFKAFKINMDTQFLMLRHQWLSDKVSELRKKLADDPNNKLLEIEYHEVLAEKNSVKKALDDKLK